MGMISYPVLTTLSAQRKCCCFYDKCHEDPLKNRLECCSVSHIKLLHADTTVCVCVHINVLILGLICSVCCMEKNRHMRIMCTKLSSRGWESSCLVLDWCKIFTQPASLVLGWNPTGQLGSADSSRTSPITSPECCQADGWCRVSEGRSTALLGAAVGYAGCTP